MLTLTLDNSLCRIQGLTPNQFRDLREILSYRDESASRFVIRRKSIKKVRAPYFAVKRYLIGKKGIFPTGLLYLVETFIKTNKLQVVRKDLRVRPKSIVFPNFEFKIKAYKEQIDAALAALKHHRGIIVAPTGLGKSLIAAHICDFIGVKTLIVVPSLELKKQLTDSLRDTFGKSLVGPLKSGRANPFITVENVDALSEEPIPGIDMVIIDEFHRSGARTYRNLNKKAWNGVYYKFGLTATPFRSKDSERLLLESVLSKVIYQIPYTAAVEKKRIVPIEAYYYDLPIQEMEGNEGSWAAVYSELVVNNARRNEYIKNLMRILDSEGKSTLCLVKEIEHGLELSREDGFHFVKGENKDNKEIITDFNSEKIKTLIGTVGVIGEGIDTKPAEYIILAAGGKSKNQFMQNCGRGVRRYGNKESCKVILFRDKSHKYLLRHFNACVKFLKEEYGVKPIKLEAL